ncbi:MAG: DUF72 domain-containing protein [Nitratiruptor sp.]|nr:DUF72 domain-containing protein [Nitratiruptor sp.]NPA83338.1 DUF72 domain-containing protein [Campylobacterota bacterium]
MYYIGTAGWTIPKAWAHLFPGPGTHLARYARRFPITEINRTFYTLPQATTFQRWYGQTPPHFRFSVKMPRAITHEARLDPAAPIEPFFQRIAYLREKLYGVLIQLPPSLPFDPATLKAFIQRINRLFTGHLFIEPRHPSWLDCPCEELGLFWVLADPGLPWPLQVQLPYLRFHGTPKRYYSAYDVAYLHQVAAYLRRFPEGVVIFDNTASGAAIGNALELMELLHGSKTQQN